MEFLNRTIYKWFIFPIQFRALPDFPEALSISHLRGMYLTLDTTNTLFTWIFNHLNGRDATFLLSSSIRVDWLKNINYFFLKLISIPVNL